MKTFTFLELKKKLNRLLQKREWLIEKFHPVDLINPLYCMRKPIYEFIKENAALAEGRVLDFGCGVKPYKELFEVNEYIGIDVEESGHESDEKFADIFYDGKKIPFADEYFQFVLSTQVFEHIYDIENSIKEIYRILEKNGIFLLTVPLGENEHEVPYDFHRFTEFGLKIFLESNGFELIKMKKSNSFKSAVRYLKICSAVQSWKNSKGKMLPLLKGVFSTVWNNLWIAASINKNTENIRFATDIFVLCKKK